MEGMAQNDNGAIFWLILATSISSITTAVLYLFQKCCGNCWSNVGSVCFQTFATFLDLHEETFYQVTNLLTLPRILQQLELQTFKVVWNHDANAQTGDYVQYGWLRLPTKSYVLTFLAVCGVTHYVYIPFDLKTVEVVGPAEAIRTLVDMSNLAATSSLDEVQLRVLRRAFGFGNTWTTADKKCVLWERRLVLVTVIITTMWVACVVPLRLVYFLAGVFGVAILAAAACMLFSRLRPRRYPSNMVVDMGVALTGARVSNSSRVPSAPPNGATEARTPNVVSAVPDSDTSTIASGCPRHEIDDSDSVVYSLLLAHGHYFEVVKQALVTPRRDSIVKFGSVARMYAVKMYPNFVHYLAERTVIPEKALLHICVYNPLIDPYLTDIYQNFQKGVDRENLLLIVLPPLPSLEACLQTPNMQRARTASSTQFVGTLGDYETLLLQMTAGFMRRLVFVLPTDENTPKPGDRAWQVWVSSVRVLGQSNCFWHSCC